MLHDEPCAREVPMLTLGAMELIGCRCHLLCKLGIDGKVWLSNFQPKVVLGHITDLWIEWYDAEGHKVHG
jgi:hypothetical protein